LFGDSDQPALVCAAQGLQVLEANDRALDLLGCTRRGLSSLRFSDSRSAKTSDLIRRIASRSSRNRTTPVRLRARKADGSTVIVAGAASPISFDHKRAVLVLVSETTDTNSRRPTAAPTSARRADRSEKLKLQIRRQEALTEFARSALTGQTARELLAAAAQMLKHTLAIDFCLAFELEGPRGELVCRAAAGWDGEPESVRFDPTGDTIAARSHRAKVPVSVDNLDLKSAPHESAWFYEAFGVKAGIGIPIKWETHAFGSIVGYSRRQRRFELDEIRYLQTVADLIAIASDRERSRAQATVADKQTSELLEAIVEHYLHIDRSWRIISVNESMAGLWNASPDSVVGEEIERFAPSFRQPEYRLLYEAAMHHGEPGQFEFQSKLNGRWYETRVRPTREGIAVYYLDITERRAAEDARFEQDRRIRGLLERLPAVTWMTDTSLTIVTAVGGGLRALQFADDELVGTNFRELYPDPQSPSIVAHEKALVGEASGYQTNFRGRTFQSRVEPLRDGQGKVIGVAGLSIDVTERVTAEQRLDDAQTLAHFGTWTFDRKTGKGLYSEELLRIFGRSQEKMPQDFSDLLGIAPVEDAKRLRRAAIEAIAKDQPWNVDHRVYDADGQERYVQNVGRYMRGTTGKIVSGFGSILDITERKLAEQELARLANFDALTGLPNRAQVSVRIAQANGHASEHQRVVVVCCIDIDGFKSINHTLGHRAGDDLLRAVSDRLQTSVRRGDIVGRLGSDEFLIVFVDVASLSDAPLLFAKIKSAFEAPFDVLGHEMFVNASCGLSSYPRDGQEPEVLIRAADTALMKSKELGGGQIVPFDAGMHAGAGERLALRNHLHRAIEREEFRVFYQPIVGAISRRLEGFEALIRWQHATLGLVPPDSFIGVTEQTGLIIPIGAWVLRRACAQAREWSEALGRRVQMSVNLSARQFTDATLPDSIAQALQETSLPPEDLELEVTEGTVVRDMRAGAATLRMIGATGVTVAIDDFGTGYSSLSYLRTFAFNTLKLDRSFVRNLPESEEDAAIARGIIGLGHALHMRVVAEGVETEAQAAFLSSEGCDLLQGYLISKPAPPEALRVVIERLGASG